VLLSITTDMVMIYDDSANIALQRLSICGVDVQTRSAFRIYSTSNPKAFGRPNGKSAWSHRLSVGTGSRFR